MNRYKENFGYILHDVRKAANRHTGSGYGADMEINGIPHSFRSDRDCNITVRLPDQTITLPPCRLKRHFISDVASFIGVRYFGYKNI